jgi:hypothetical protein
MPGVVRCCRVGCGPDVAPGHAEGTAGEDQPRSSVAAMVTRLNRRGRPVLGDHLPRWQGSEGVQQVTEPALGRRVVLSRWADS